MDKIKGDYEVKIEELNRQNQSNILSIIQQTTLQKPEFEECYTQTEVTS